MKTCDNHRLKGWFYLPDSPADRVPGILIWSQNSGADLELIGGIFPEPQQDQPNGTNEYSPKFSRDVLPSTIYGELDSGKKVCLWGAERRSFKAGFRNQIQEEFWHSSWVCIGAHVASADCRVFNSFRVALDNLYYLTSDARFVTPQWAQIEGVEHPGEKQADGTLICPFTLPVVGGYRAGWAKGSFADATYSINTHATRPFISEATEADPALKLEFMMKRRRRGASIEILVGADASISLIDDLPTSAEDLLHRTSPLLGLMSLATFNTSGIEWMEAQTVDGEKVSFFCHTGHQSKPDLQTEAGSPIFTLNDVSLGIFMETWQRLTSGDQSRYAWNLVVGLIGHSPLLVEEHLSQVLAAAEGFDTWCLAGGKNSDLKKRLLRLHDRLSAELKARLQLDVDKWVDWAVWARNYVAHGGSKKHRIISDYYQFKIISDSVHLVTYLAALSEFRITDEKLLGAITRHPRLKVLADRCADIPDLPATED